MISYTYRFIDIDNNIIYVGKTTSMDKRMAQHFGGKGHLSPSCYNSVARIEYQKHSSESDALVYETYYITKYDPKFNKMQKSRDIPTIKLEEKEWRLFREYKKSKATNSTMNDLGLFRRVIVGGLWLVILYQIIKFAIEMM